MRIAYGLHDLGLAVRRRATQEPGLIAQSTGDHTRIVAAVSRGEPDKAAEAMRVRLDHIEESARRLAAAAAPSRPRKSRQVHAAEAAAMSRVSANRGQARPG